MPIRHITPELSLAIGAVVVLLAAITLPRERQAWCAGLAGLAIVAAAAAGIWLSLAVPEQLTFHGTWAVDGIKAWSSYAILAATGGVVAMSPRWFATDTRHGEWYAIVLLSALGAILLAGAADLAELVVAALLSSVTGYTLASYHRASRACAEAGAKIYFLGALTNPMLFLGAVLLYGVAATTRYQGLADVLAGGATDQVLVGAGLALVFAGLAFELGAFPVHAWVADVTQGSPAPAAAFVTVVPKIGALAALIRLVDVVPDGAAPWRPVLAIQAALTMTIGNLAALWQRDVRRLIGWSSVSQIGYGMMAAVAIGRSALALPSLVLFVVGYAAANLGALAVVVSLRGRTALHHYRGLGRTRPGHALGLTLVFLSLVGIPPLVGFASKLALFTATIDAGYAWLAVVAVVNTVVSLFYYLRVVAVMYFREPAETPALLGPRSRWVAWVAAGSVVVLGLAAQLMYRGSHGAELLPRAATSVAISATHAPPR